MTQKHSTESGALGLTLLPTGGELTPVAVSEHFSDRMTDMEASRTPGEREMLALHNVSIHEAMKEGGLLNAVTPQVEQAFPEGNLSDITAYARVNIHKEYPDQRGQVLLQFARKGEDGGMFLIVAEDDKQGVMRPRAGEGKEPIKAEAVEYLIDLSNEGVRVANN